jgi:hypothetical protein
MSKKKPLARKKPPRKKKAPGKTRSHVKGEECFVIMPFGGWFDSYYTAIFIPAIEATGLRSVRADDIFRPSPIINDIWAFTKRAKIVLADLSKKNPNVFYELGLAHSLSKPAILVTEAITDVPFDLQSLRVIVYNKDEPDWGNILKRKITNSIQEVLDAPQSAVLPTFLNVRDASPRPQVSAHEKELLNIRQEIDSMRREMGHGTPPNVPPPIGPGEARDLIASMLTAKAPEYLIVREVGSRGAPENWVRNTIQELRKPITGRRSTTVTPKKAPSNTVGAVAAPAIATSKRVKTPRQKRSTRTRG